MNKRIKMHDGKFSLTLAPPYALMADRRATTILYFIAICVHTSLKLIMFLFFIMWLMSAFGNPSPKEMMLLVFAVALLFPVALCRKFVLYIKNVRGVR